MTRRFRTWLPAALAAAGLALLGPPRRAQADPAPTIEFSAVVTDTSGKILAVEDTGPVTDGNPNIITTTTVPGLIQVTNGIHTAADKLPAPYNPIGGYLDSFVSAVANISTQELISYVVVSANNFTPTVNLANISMSGTWLNNTGATTGSSILGRFFNDPGNGLSRVDGTVGATFSLANPTDFHQAGSQVGTDLVSTAGSGQQQTFDIPAQNNLPVTDPGAYGMTLFFRLDLTPGGTLTNRDQTETKIATVVPEPATLAAVLTGLPLLGYRALRRRRRAAR
jgi:hypothetical protein